MREPAGLSRRIFLGASALVAPAAALAQSAPPKGRLKQAATRGCFGALGKDFEKLCELASRLGLKGVDLVGPAEYPILKKYGLLPTMIYGTRSIPNGINRTENHATCEKQIRDGIAQAVEQGGPNVIVLSGNRAGMPEEEGIVNSVAFFNKVKAEAEDKRITLCLELLNSKVNHKDYMCDRTSWGVEVCKRVNSPRVKLLYDIYHMQIMEGDVIRTLRDNIKWIGHFHTAGNPGRHELDATQELNYRPIAQAIVDTGFTGYLAHEYSPVGDPTKGIEEAVRICDV
jgi:hydroxypyruvate isomerase